MQRVYADFYDQLAAVKQEIVEAPSSPAGSEKSVKTKTKKDIQKHKKYIRDIVSDATLLVCHFPHKGSIR